MSSVTPSVPRSGVALAALALKSLSGEREFRRVHAQGAVVRHALFTMRITPYRPRYGERWYPAAIVGIIISKKTLKHAVKRNRVRRRMREALRTLPQLPACRVTLHPTVQVLDVPFEQLQSELHQALLRGLSMPARKAGAKPARKGAGKVDSGKAGAGGPT